MTTEQIPAEIAALNDRFRRLGPRSGIPGRRVATVGVSALPFDMQMAIWRIVGRFDDFHLDNDPHGEHDFGSFLLEGAGKLFWKIDYYADSAMQWGAETPGDSARSYRVLTVMLADEY